jgi:hypothetical protein
MAWGRCTEGGIGKLLHCWRLGNASKEVVEHADNQKKSHLLGLGAAFGAGKMCPAGENTKILLGVRCLDGRPAQAPFADVTNREPPAMSSHLSVVLGINSSFGQRRRRAQVDRTV